MIATRSGSDAPMICAKSRRTRALGSKKSGTSEPGRRLDAIERPASGSGDALRGRRHERAVEVVRLGRQREERPVTALLRPRCYPSLSSSYATPSTPLRLSSANGDRWSSNPGSASVPVISSLDRPACISRRVNSSAAVK